MRRLKSAIAVIVALGLLAGLAWFGERWARSEVENRVEARIAEALPDLDGDVDAAVGGRFVIPQLIGGALEDVTITAPEVIVDGIAIQDVVATAQDIPIRGDGAIASVQVTGTAPIESVIAAVERRVEFPEGVELELRDGEVALVTSVLGLPLEAYVTLTAQSRTIGFEVDRFVLGESEVTAEEIPIDLSSILGDATITLDALPETIELTGLEVTDDGVQLELTGADVEI